MKHYNIPIFISHFGCPNDCVFCNQKKINGKETDVSLEDIRETIDSYLETLPKKSKKEVAFFGGTFTGISMNLQKQYLEVVNEYIEKGVVDGIRLSTRPDYINKEIVEQLVKYNVTTVELGVQSLDEEVLKKTDRFYEIDKVYEAVKLLKETDIEIGIQLMIGLPGATDESDYLSAKKVVELKPDIARIYPTLVIKETELARMFLNNEYKALSLEEATKRCLKIYSLLEYNDINVVRVGLQPTEDLNDSENVLGGPFHPAFRELVEGELYYNFIKRVTNEDENIEVQVVEQNISKVVGIRKVNRERFKNRLNIRINKLLEKDVIVINEKKYTRKEVLKGEVNEPDNIKYESI